MDRFETVFWSGQSLEQLYQQVSARDAYGIAALFVAAMREWKRTYESGVRSLLGLGGRIDRVMDVTLAREIDRLERRLLVLATVGSSAPFIGLFGTVWGIMTSFQAIAASKNTNLVGRRARHRRGAARDGARPARRHSGGRLLQQVLRAGVAARHAHGRVRRRVRRHPVAPDRRAGRRLMAASFPRIGRSRRGRRHKARRRHLPMAEINVTPFVDVMLVLLIVFMVAAPLLTVGVPIDLPEDAGEADGRRQQADHSFDQGGRQDLSAGRRRSTLDELVSTLQAIAKNGLEERIFVRGDKDADYGTVMQVMGRLNSAGYKKIGLVTLEETDS